ncbi:proton-coupled folate transporter-like [Diadema setosum]|uniref:proton-coupled folate transporter-like n=1 Tax=Diadema setosum TaxID=31175 RepID=UPI003B3A4F3E
MYQSRRTSLASSSLDINSLSTDIRSVRTTGREVARDRWITVEPILFLASMSSGILLVTRLQYLRARIAHDFFNQSSDFGANVSACDESLNSSSYAIEQAVQARLSLYALILNALSTFPAIFTTILIGSLSDRIGRRVGLVTPLVGIVIQTAIYVAVYYLRLPIWVCFIADTLQGVTGGYGLLLSTASAYVVDIVEDEMRTWRIVVVEIFLVLGGGLIQPINGFLIKYFGMGVAFDLALGVALPGLLYAMLPWFTPETIDHEANKLDSLSDKLSDIFRGIFSTLSVRSGGRQWKILTLCTAELFLVTCINGVQITTTYGLGPPLCWGPATVGYFTAALAISPCVGVPVAVKVLSLCMNELWLMHSGTVFLLATFVDMALAPSTPFIFAGVAPYSIGTLVSPVMRGVLSKIVANHEQGSIFAMAGCIHNISQFIGPLVSNAVYSSTVALYAPLVFWLFAGLLVIPTVLIG